MQVQNRLLSLAIASAIAAAATPAMAANQINRSVAARAHGLVDGTASKLVHRDAADAFVARRTIVDAKGNEHVRFDRTYRGLPVIGGDFVVHSRNGKVTSVSQSLNTRLRPSVTPRISGDDAIDLAGVDFGTGFRGLPSSRLVVYAVDTSPVLAYEVNYAGVKADQTPTNMRYFVDARSGRILNKWDTVHTALPGPGGGTGGCTRPIAAAGSGKTNTAGNVRLNTIKCGSLYQLKDSTRGNGETRNMGGRWGDDNGSIFTDSDNVWGNNTMANSQTVAAEAHYAVAVTWDYFKGKHGRLGIFGDGRGVVARVHYGRNYVNAFWDGTRMTFGDGDNGVTSNPLTMLDVAGHEMSHGVNHATADLVYSGESGGLNEANSDIFGTMVEFHANNASDPGDYLIGEKVFVNNPGGTKALRYMFKPSLDGDSPDCWNSEIKYLDVHYSSGVANHFFYLLAEGTVVPAGFGAGTAANLTPASLVCAGPSKLVGIGRDAAARIWYRALDVYMTSNTQYTGTSGARALTLKAATDLYGSTSTQYKAVAAAWTAVGVN